MTKYCLVCGKPLRENTWGIFCGNKCSTSSNVDAIKYRITQEIKTTEDFIEKYKKASGCDFSRKDKITTMHKRIVCYSIIKLLGVSSVSLGKVLRIDHTTAIYHALKVNDNEKEMAQCFVDTGKIHQHHEEKEAIKTKTEFELNILKYNFSYSGKAV